MKYLSYVLIALLVLSKTATSDYDRSELEEYMEPEDNYYLLAIGTVMQAVAAAWGGICKLFGYSVKKSLKYMVTEKGFDYFDGSSQIQLLTNFRGDSLDVLQENLIRRWEGDESRSRQVIEALFRIIPGTERNVWNQNDLVFKKGKKGEMAYGAVFSAALDNGNYHFIIIDSEAKFRLSRELFILTTTKSFGIFSSSSSSKLIYRDRALDDDDINALMYFLRLVSLRTVAGSFGMKHQFQYPSL